jgi:hypothetical protein
MVCVVGFALSVIVRVALSLPTMAGVHVTFNVQVPPAASVDGDNGQLLVCAKSVAPLKAIDEILRGALPVFVSVEV